MTIALLHTCPFPKSSASSMVSGSLSSVVSGRLNEMAAPNRLKPPMMRKGARGLKWP